MTMVKKRSGVVQEYNRSKIEESIKRAGAKDEVAKRVAESIAVQENLTTQDLRQRIGEELRKADPASAESYLSTRRLKVKVSPETPLDQGRVSEHLGKLFEQQKVLPASLYYGARMTEVRLEPAHKAYGEIWLNQSVLDRLAASEGTRISVRFRRAAGQPSAGPRPPAQSATVQAQPAVPGPQPR